MAWGWGLPFNVLISFTYILSNAPQKSIKSPHSNDLFYSDMTKTTIFFFYLVRKHNSICVHKTIFVQYCKQLPVIEIYMYIPPPPKQQNLICKISNAIWSIYWAIVKSRNSFIGNIIHENLNMHFKILYLLHLLFTHTRTMYTTHFIINLLPIK